MTLAALNDTIRGFQAERQELQSASLILHAWGILLFNCIVYLYQGNNNL